MVSLGGGWMEHLTADGKCYYHNTNTNSTQWEKPLISAVPSVPSGPPPLPVKQTQAPAVASKPAAALGGGGGSAAPPGDLLAAIRGGAALKKADTIDKSAPRAGGGVVESHTRKGSGSSGGPYGAGGGGFGGELQNALKARSNSTAVGGAGKPGGPPPIPAMSGAPSIPPFNPAVYGKNPVTSSTPPSTYSSPPAYGGPPPIPVVNSVPSSSGRGTVEQRLAALESKIDRIIAHLRC